jgi:hypothetical protein
MALVPLKALIKPQKMRASWLTYGVVDKSRRKKKKGASGILGVKKGTGFKEMIKGKRDESSLVNLDDLFDGPETPQDGLDEAVIGRAREAFRRAYGKARKALRELVRKARGKKKPKVRPKPKVKKARLPDRVRSKGKPGGIQPKAPPPSEPRAGPEPPPQAKVSKIKTLPVPPIPKVSREPPPVKALQKKAPEIPKRPKGLGPEIPFPKTAKIRRTKAGRLKGAVNYSNMYKHMVRAIHNSVVDRGYPTRGTPAKASQAIARGRMIKYGYAKRKKKEGGVADRFGIELTGKGVNRNWRRHTTAEPRGVTIHKDRDYWAIIATDPL